MGQIETLIDEELSKLESENNPENQYNIQYNIIILKNRAKYLLDNYRDIKKFVVFYLNYIEPANYGYDQFNNEKIDLLLKFLTPDQQIAIIDFSISNIKNKLPEYDLSWLVERRRKAEVLNIFLSRNTVEYPRAILLYTGLKFSRLLASIFILYIIINLILLPNPNPSMQFFHVEYDHYTNSFISNHSLNLLALLCGVEDEMKITPVGWYPLILMCIGKLFFAVLFINFIYARIIDKFSIR